MRGISQDMWCGVLQDADEGHPPDVTVLADVEEQQPAAV